MRPNISILVGINAHSISADCQKSALIDEQMDILTKKYGRALINDDADYQTLKNMIMDRIKTVKIQELIDMLKDSPYCL